MYTFVFDLEFIELFSLYEEEEIKMNSLSLVSVLMREYTEYTPIIISEKHRTNEELLEDESTNYLIRNLYEVSNIKVKSISDFDKIDHFSQTIFFLAANENKAKELREKNALVFTFSMLEKELWQFDRTLNFKAENTKEFLEKSKDHISTKSSIRVCDKYLLKDESNYEEFLDFLKSFFLTNQLSISLHFKEYPNIGWTKSQRENFLAKIKKTTNDSGIFKNSKFYWLGNEKCTKKITDELKKIHDRFVYHDHFIIETGSGFDELGKLEINNSSIQVYNILDKFTYKKLKRDLKLLKNYQKLISDYPHYDYPSEV